MNINEKAAYVKGLADGLGLDEEKKDVKVIKALLDLVSEMADKISLLEEDMDQAYDELDAIDEDLTDVEDYLWEEDDEDEDDDYDDYDEDVDGPLYEITCPKCGEVTCVTEDMLENGDIGCFNCGEPFDIDLSELDALDGADGCEEKE